MAVHVLPVDDVRKHRYSDKCACRPTVETSDETGLYRTPLLIHNSFDFRESLEDQTLPGEKQWQVLEL